MPQLLKENEVSYYLGEKHIYPKGSGNDNSGIFMYQLDLGQTDISIPGNYPIQDSNLASVVKEAVDAGKQVYISISYNQDSHLIVPMSGFATIDENNIYLFQIIAFTANPVDEGYILASYNLQIIYNESQEYANLEVIRKSIV